MNNRNGILQVPGKLMIAGEYAVLEPKQEAVVVAVNKYVTAKIEESYIHTLTIASLGIESIHMSFTNNGVEFHGRDMRLAYVTSAMEVVAKYLIERKIPITPFSLTIDSNLNHEESGIKYGLGSSAAIVVAVISSMLYYYGEFHGDEDRLNIYKLSVIAHLKVQGNGSGADIAASVYGGWIRYSMYDTKWLREVLEFQHNMVSITQMPWPHLIIDKLPSPKNIKLAVGWTKEAVKTGDMVHQIQEFKKTNHKAYMDFVYESTIAVSTLVKAFLLDDNALFLKAIRDNREALVKLGKVSKVMIETNSMVDLCNIAQVFGSGKSSGAGGGDCGIGFVIDTTYYNKLCTMWEQVGIIPLTIDVSYTGCRILG